ncbi:MAG: FAD-binding oxidoreductase [Oscillatoriales cyanobacterium SM2_2_1]|nr:FAD-binding oxidoreductase [Oscillatoriales cyanobacterium SM2_2_1]
MTGSWDWIVVGGGLCGSALAYELQRVGLAVLLLERDRPVRGATARSYGGIPYWAGTTALTQTLCREGIALHRNLSAELGRDTSLRELDLLLWQDLAADGAAVTRSYAECLFPPQNLTPEEAHSREPLLNPGAISGALLVRHAHVDPLTFITAYQEAFLKLGGAMVMAQVTGWQKDGCHGVGIQTETEIYIGAEFALCVGSETRLLCAQLDLESPVYFTHGEVLRMAPEVAPPMHCMVMPADVTRFAQEAATSTPEHDLLWRSPDYELIPPSVDAGVVPFDDRSLRVGQLSRVHTRGMPPHDPAASEQAIRDAIRPLFPSLADLPAQWHHSLVSFSRDGLPLVGLPYGSKNVHLFTGFTTPFIYAPPLARRFAAAVTGGQTHDSLLTQVSPRRFLD